MSSVYKTSISEPPYTTTHGKIVAHCCFRLSAPRIFRRVVWQRFQNLYTPLHQPVAVSPLHPIHIFTNKINDTRLSVNGFCALH